MPVGFPEFEITTEPRCPVILLCDTSGSMSGEPIDALNNGLKTFCDGIAMDDQASLRVEAALVTFGPVQVVQDFTAIDGFIPPKLTANGGTPMGEAIELALDLLEKRKKDYKDNGIQYYRPWVFLITDGAPTDEWANAAQKVRQADLGQKMLFFAVGVQGADMSTLTQIAPVGRPPMLLNGLDFKSLFRWLSDSMQKVSGGKVGAPVDLPPVGWGTIPG
jgi:uncharacterized protein YegL